MTRLRAVPPLPPRPPEGHKGTFGHLLVLAGSPGMIGAPALCGVSALRAGCGLVYVATPEEALPWVLMQVPELVGVPLPRSGRWQRLSAAAAKATALVAGPGMGLGAGPLARLRMLLRLEKPCVLDADGITLLAQGSIRREAIAARLVLTPHPGEMARLAKWLRLGEVPSDEAGRIALAGAAAGRLGQVVVLKGHHTVISDGSRYRVNESGDSSLAKAGTGDVLSGVLGSLLAQGMERFDAASLAVHLHGVAGEMAGRRLGPRSVLARDVAESLHAAFSSHHPAHAR